MSMGFYQGLLGKEICGYLLKGIRRLGTQGVLYRATHVKSGYEAAVRMVPKAPKKAIRRLALITQQLRATSHPHILAWRSIFRTKKMVCTAAVMANRGSLRRRLAEEGPLREAEVVRCMYQSRSELLHCWMPLTSRSDLVNDLGSSSGNARNPSDLALKQNLIETGGSRTTGVL